jgi:hypothetical protein
MCRTLITIGIILLIAGGCCYIGRNRMSTSEIIQLFAAIILTLSAVTAYNSFRSYQEHNQPFCAVKMVRADVVKMTTVKPEPREDVVIELAAVIKNFGKYIAKNVSYEWIVDVIKNFEPNGKQPATIEVWRNGKSHIFTMLPEQELDNFFIQIGEENFKTLVDGYKSGLLLNVIVKYKDTDEKMQQYSCTYLISRLKSTLQEKPEVTIYESKFEAIPSKNQIS